MAKAFPWGGIQHSDEELGVDLGRMQVLLCTRWETMASDQIAFLSLPPLENEGNST